MQKALIQNRIITRFLAAILCAAILAPPLPVHAQTFGGFSIRAVIPENQVDAKQTYFDLRMKPGDEQDVQVVITNSRTEALSAEVRLNAASTGRNGTIAYTNPNVRDSAMTLAVTDVAAPLSQNITVPPNGSETVTIRIKMPDEPIDGVLLGGIAVTGNDTGSDTQAVQGVSLKNTITYVTALKLTTDDSEVAPDFELASVAPQLVNYRTAIVATLRNKAARIVKDMEIKAEVYRKGSDTPLHDLALTNAEMAPLSTGAFVINWQDEALRAGTYRLHMTANYNGRLWEWDEEFTIAGEAGDLNKDAVGLKRNDAWLYISLGILALILVGVVAFLLGRRKKERED